MGEWFTIEPDPGVFTELIQKFGVKGIEVSEISSLGQLSEFFPIHGLIFLFEMKTSIKKFSEVLYNPDMFFACQMAKNVYPTQAILSILLNSRISLGEELSKFKQLVMPLDPANRGRAISKSSFIRQAHNGFAQQEPLEFVDTNIAKNVEGHHLVSFVHAHGKIYELDCLQSAPISHGHCPEGQWAESVKSVIDKRMQQFSGNGIQFKLLAVVNNKIDDLKKIVRSNRLKIVAAKTKLMSLDQEVEEDEMDQEFDEEYFMGLTDDLDLLKAELAILEEEGKTYKEELELENRKYKKWKAENQRRRHNYAPFIVSLLEKLADEKKLIPILEAVKEKQAKTAGNK